MACLAFDRGRGGATEKSPGEDGMAGFSEGGICDAHILSSSVTAPVASPSSASNMVGGFSVSFHI
jgi:hypothetical protein